MKRDLELIKRILEEVESAPTYDQPVYINFPDYDEDTVEYHNILLGESGYIVTNSNKHVGTYPVRLTTKGHDFIDAARDNGIWSKTLSIIKEKGGSFTLEIVKTLLIDLTKVKLGLK